MTPTAPRPSLRSFWQDLPREGQLLLSVVAFEFIGTGLVLPFWVVYLHDLRGYSYQTVGILLAVMSAAGVAAAVPGGKLIDRAGARRTMLLILAAAIVGQTLVAFAGTLALTTLAIMIIGAGFGMGWPASQSLIASVVPSPIRARYFGINFSLLNLGIGIGGIAGGFIADVHHLVSFQVMYLGDAVSYLPSVFLLCVPLRHIGGPAERPEGTDETEDVSYLQVLRAPAMRTLTTLFFVSAFVGYSQLSAGMPAYSRAIGHVSPRGLGFAFAANTLVIVLLQLVILQRIEGRRRTSVIVVMSVIWASSWALLAASGIAPGTIGATLFVGACASVFALGETLLQPTMPAIVNDLAPDHLRGRYNALTTISFQCASILGPIVAGLMIDHHLHLEFIALLVVGCGVTAWLSAVRLEPQLNAVANGLAKPDGPAPAEPVQLTQVAEQAARTSP